MKLCLLTYNIARAYALPQLIELAKRTGFAALEVRAEQGHQHGVELERTRQERRDIRRQVEDAYLDLAAVGTGCRFESPDAQERGRQIDRAKGYVELTHDVGATRVRVFGNDIPAQVEREECVRYVGESLRELGQFAEPSGVDVLLEMHGQFNFWKFALGAVRHAGHPSVGLVYNCDHRDLVAGSVAPTYSHVRRHIRHVHMHDFERGAPAYFPYKELFRLLHRDGYPGYLSAELSPSADPDGVLALYALLAREWLAQAAKSDD